MKLLNLSFILLGFIAVTSSRPIESAHGTIETPQNQEPKNLHPQSSSKGILITPHSKDPIYPFQFQTDAPDAPGEDSPTTHVSANEYLGVESQTPTNTVNDPTTTTQIHRRHSSFTKWIKHVASKVNIAKVAKVAEGALKLATKVL